MLPCCFLTPSILTQDFCRHSSSCFLPSFLCSLSSFLFFSLLFLKSFFFACIVVLFWGLHHWACRILAPHPGIKPTPPALEAWHLNHWTTKEVPFPPSFFHTLRSTMPGAPREAELDA